MRYSNTVRNPLLDWISQGYKSEICKILFIAMGDNPSPLAI